MGQLKPGATYIYERANGQVFAREKGSNERILIGEDYDSRTNDGRPIMEHMKENQLWGNIRRAAKFNPALQEALERAIIIYELSKPDKDTPLLWHPV